MILLVTSRREEDATRPRIPGGSPCNQTSYVKAQGSRHQCSSDPVSEVTQCHFTGYWSNQSQAHFDFKGRNDEFWSHVWTMFSNCPSYYYFWNCARIPWSEVLWMLLSLLRYLLVPVAWKNACVSTCTVGVAVTLAGEGTATGAHVRRCLSVNTYWEAGWGCAHVSAGLVQAFLPEWALMVVSPAYPFPESQAHSQLPTYFHMDTCWAPQMSHSQDRTLDLLSQSQAAPLPVCKFLLSVYVICLLFSNLTTVTWAQTNFSPCNSLPGGKAEYSRPLTS